MLGIYHSIEKVFILTDKVFNLVAKTYFLHWGIKL